MGAIPIQGNWIGYTPVPGKRTAWNETRLCRFMQGWCQLDVDQLRNPRQSAALRRLAGQWNAPRMVQELKQAGVEVFTFHARSHAGNFFYDTRVGHKHNLLGHRDFLGEIVAECGKKDIATVAIFQVCFDQRTYDEHPEWRKT